MINQQQYQLNATEISMAVIGMVIGVGVLTVPRNLAEATGTADGWISMLLSGLIVILIVYLYLRLQQSFLGMTLLEYIAQGSIGKWLAYSLAFFFFLYFLCLLGYEASLLSTVIRLYLLNQTPSEVIIGSMLLTTTYAVSKGLQGIIHLSLLFVPITFIISIILVLSNVGQITLDAFMPVMADGIGPVLAGMKVSAPSLLGFEIIFFFLAYTKPQSVRALPAVLAIAMITLFTALVTIISYGVFSIDATAYITFPTVDLAKEIELPGSFVERLESVFITIWLMTLFNTMSICHFLCVLILKKHFIKSKSGKLFPSLVMFLAFLIAFLPYSLTEAFLFGKWISWLGMILVVTSLLSGYLTLWVRAKRKNSEAKAVNP